jgi:hypothetical protein
MRRALACFLVIGVAGCSGGIMNAQYDGPELKVAALASHQVDDKDLLVKIPEWAGRIESARQTNNSSGVKQEIVVSGGTRGDNFVEVAVETGGVRNVDGFAKAHAPSSEDIDEELKARFPGVAMRAIPKSEAGAETRYDLAVGRAADGARCLYAWYWTDNYRVASDPSGIATVESMFSRRKDPASLRIRLCSKYVTLDDYASLARQIRFVRAADIERVVSGASTTPEEAARSELHPPDTTLEDATVGTAGGEPAPKATVRAASASAHRRLARNASPVDKKLAAPSQPEAGAGGGPRYLATPPAGTAGDSAPGATSVPSAVGASYPAQGQMLNLPAAALRGPANGVSAPASPASGAN